MIRTAHLSLCVCILSLLAVSAVFADYYTYTDSRGVVTMTNKLESVPARYRSKVKVTKEDPPAKAAAQQGEPVAAQDAPPAAAPADDSFLSRVKSLPWAKPVAYAGIAIACLWGINALCWRLRSPHLAKFLYLAFFCGVLLFLYKAYTDRMADTFLKLKEDANAVVNKTKTRQPPQELVQ